MKLAKSGFSGMVLSTFPDRVAVAIELSHPAGVSTKSAEVERVSAVPDPTTTGRSWGKSVNGSIKPFVTKPPVMPFVGRQIAREAGVVCRIDPRRKGNSMMLPFLCQAGWRASNNSLR